ncbi:MAG: hypothetical protein V9E94_01435 [Microthrixaceae bacterium]
MNKNAIPYDPQKPMIGSGIRVGTPSVTTQGMAEPDMAEIGALIARAITEPGCRRRHRRAGAHVGGPPPRLRSDLRADRGVTLHLVREYLLCLFAAAAVTLPDDARGAGAGDPGRRHGRGARPRRALDPDTALGRPGA